MVNGVNTGDNITDPVNELQKEPRLWHFDAKMDINIIMIISAFYKEQIDQMRELYLNLFSVKTAWYKTAKTC